ncbi:MFS transporter [Burkholderiaceae bacterium FT117]|uniref:MFS transporter n=1 Tax=Zeimonas sediminis TaxID=2944268 RepID=UPI002342CBE7|nr:MFS transporter [Zeimonas sediminis]MCM5569988.1 MFS transporter [Zeimonas sediminis]
MTSLLLNIAHALDHLVLLIFATAVGAIAADFGVGRWEDLMPYTAGAFVMFGLGSVPSGRLGDLWGRRSMMLVFFFGIGAATLLVAATQNPWQMAAALALMGAFASIYHPVGIPMLVQGATRPGRTIGVNGLAGNLGIALAAISTGLLVQFAGWRAAFVVPGVVAIACGLLFMKVAPAETESPARRAGKALDISARDRQRAFVVMTLTAVTGGLIFNFTTNGNGELLKSRLPLLLEQPALMGALLAGVYGIASLAQVVVGRLIDRVPMKTLMLAIMAMQPVLFGLAAASQGWAFYAVMIVFMIFVFGAIPFTDALIVRFVDDRMRSRVTGMRLAVSFGVSSLAVWLLGPLVKASGFTTLLLMLAGISALATLFAAWLPAQPAPVPAPLPASEPAAASGPAPAPR